ncbi:MAG: Calx-beta domain-containing protein, partial [Mycobacteriaceae bacterium]
MRSVSARGWGAARRLALLTVALSVVANLGPAPAAIAASRTIKGPSATAAASSPGISAPPDTLVGEADGHVDLPVRLNTPGLSTVTVNYATAYGSATPGNICNGRYSDVSGTLTYAPGETTKVIRIDINDCHLTGLSSFTLNLSTPVNATITRASTRIGIVGDANPSTNPSLYVRDAITDTTDGTINVPVLLGGPAGTPSSSTVTVNYATHDATATAGTDYTATTGTLTFGPGQTVKNIAVPITARTGSAPTRSFTITLTSPTNATLIDDTGVVTIGASGGTAVSSPGISAPPDTLVGEAEGYLDLPVRLNTPGLSTVTVNYATAYGSATPGNICNGRYSDVSGTLTY